MSGFLESLFEIAFGFGEVFGQVDAEDFIWGLMHADAEAVVEKAELLKLLGLFEITRF